MRYLIDFLTILLVILGWLAGLVVVKGAWLTTVAILFPPYAWYVCMERLMK